MPQDLLHPGAQQTMVMQTQAVGLVLGAHDAHTAVYSANRTEACRLAAEKLDEGSVKSENRRMLTQEKGKEACAHGREQQALPGRSLLHLLLHELFQALPLQLHLSLETLSLYIGRPIAPVISIPVLAEDSVPLPAGYSRLILCACVPI